MTTPPNDSSAKGPGGQRSFAFTLFGFSVGIATCYTFLNIKDLDSISFSSSGLLTGKAATATTKQQPLDNDLPIYGLLHMSKTAGTEINGALAMHYERVCGNKGYSYDAYQANKRYMASNCTTGFKWCVQDAMSKYYNDTMRNRGFVDTELMIEIGLEDCDYVAVEVEHNFWKSKFLPLGGQKVKKELHVPCRQDLVDHLMSMANHKRQTFDCSTEDLKGEIGRVMMTPNRFNKSLLQLEEQRDIFSLKCFNPLPIEPYLEHMSQKLQQKRFHTRYAPRWKNNQKLRIRDKENECIWKNKMLLNLVRKILVEDYDYFSYCAKCLGTKNDLLHIG